MFLFGMAEEMPKQLNCWQDGVLNCHKMWRVRLPSSAGIDLMIALWQGLLMQFLIS